eukprot:1406377-Amphidinium_carterae.1
MSIPPDGFRIPGNSAASMRPSSMNNIPSSSASFFEAMDKNHDGILTRSELSLGQPVPTFTSVSSFGPPKLGSSASNMKKLDESRIMHGALPTGSMQSVASAPGSVRAAPDTASFKFDSGRDLPGSKVLSSTGSFR